jgi:hypothetical protein
MTGPIFGEFTVCHILVIFVSSEGTGNVGFDEC